MSPMILDGNAAASQLRDELRQKITALAAQGKQPGLAVVLVGENPASKVYVANKAKQTKEIGMLSVEHRLPEETSEADLLATVEKLNHDPAIHGILVQLPLPEHINAEKVLESINPDKDVDGFHAVNAGKLAIGMNALVPCTPLGSVYLAKMYKKDLSGLHAVVIGRSNIVGKPVAQLLLQENCTVTIVHSRTKNIADICRQADLLVAAIGKPLFVSADMVKDGAIVIDVGINRVPKPDGGSRIVGDVDFDVVKDKTAAITPVPGGVGPMTIAFLLANTLRAFELSEARKH
ncbi:MAG: bifunctional methylenetetrahydrofolate dehydrogenase/methenyltetrahydrofolate cyclohydrolase FolD [Hyphomicrobiales bacterium]